MASRRWIASGPHVADALRTGDETARSARPDAGDEICVDDARAPAYAGATVESSDNAGDFTGASIEALLSPHVRALTPPTSLSPLPY
ncbi:MAG: hypothetical protein O2843_03090, partial [Chloroflexi bacterium]|nr:hypothetical protein [Chloroflexota bacterium]